MSDRPDIATTIDDELRAAWELMRPNPCPECGGTGADDVDGGRPLICRACNGSGLASEASR